MLVRGNAPGQRRNRELNGGAPPGWVRVQLHVEKVELREPTLAPIYAVVSSWHDADVIEATVRNCFDQGCERVYLLDNASPDNTAEVARAAGVNDVITYRTEFYDDDLRVRKQNEIVRRVTAEERHPELWWIVLDADEFPAGRDGKTVAALLRSLPAQINTVGSDFIDLYPSNGEAYRIGAHPALCMSRGVWRRGGIRHYCACGHWKHAIVRYRDGIHDLAHFRGNHGLAASKQNRGVVLAVESQFDVPFFHAPIREESATRARLNALCESGRNQWDDHVTNSQGAIKRWQALDNIYAGRWREVNLPHTQVYGRSVTGLALYPWRVLAPSVVLITHLGEEHANRNAGG